MNYALTSHGIR